MTDQNQLILEHLSQFISEHKKEFVERVLQARTRQVTVVMEDIYQSQNASAVIRTCECMGIQDVHMVENTTKYSINPRVLKGADKWIDLYRHASGEHNNTEAAFEKLRADGYRIVVADQTSLFTIWRKPERLLLFLGTNCVVFRVRRFRYATKRSEYRCMDLLKASISQSVSRYA